jgi:hypothetical protein
MYSIDHFIPHIIYKAKHTAQQNTKRFLKKKRSPLLIHYKLRSKIFKKY